MSSRVKDNAAWILQTIEGLMENALTTRPGYQRKRVLSK